MWTNVEHSNPRVPKMETLSGSPLLRCISLRLESVVPKKRKIVEGPPGWVAPPCGWVSDSDDEMDDTDLQRLLTETADPLPIDHTSRIIWQNENVGS